MPAFSSPPVQAEESKLVDMQQGIACTDSRVPPLEALPGLGRPGPQYFVCTSFPALILINLPRDHLEKGIFSGCTDT